MTTRLVAVDVSGEVGPGDGERVGVSIGLMVLLDHVDEGERARRIGAAVRQVLARASGLVEVGGRRRLLFAGRPITIWRSEQADGRVATVLLSRWEDEPDGDLEVAVLERRGAGGGWIQ